MSYVFVKIAFVGEREKKRRMEHSKEVAIWNWPNKSRCYFTLFISMHMIWWNVSVKQHLRSFGECGGHALKWNQLQQQTTAAATQWKKTHTPNIKLRTFPSHRSTVLVDLNVALVLARTSISNTPISFALFWDLTSKCAVIKYKTFGIANCYRCVPFSLVHLGNLLSSLLSYILHLFPMFIPI